MEGTSINVVSKYRGDSKTICLLVWRQVAHLIAHNLKLVAAGHHLLVLSCEEVVRDDKVLIMIPACTYPRSTLHSLAFSINLASVQADETAMILTFVLKET